jgi:hypothetical protein
MASNNLFPTPTVDKNGKQTTVYRKADRPLEPLRQFPALTLPEHSDDISGVANKWEARQEMLRGISQYASEEMKCGNSQRDIKKHIMTFPDDLLERIESCQKEGSLWSRRVSARLVELSDFNEVSETAHFSPLISDDILDNAARAMIQSLHYYPQLPKSKDYSQESTELRLQAEALMRVIDAAMDHGICGWNGVHGESLVIKVEGFAEMVIENKDRAEVIVDFIRERKRIDVDALREILSTDVPALSRGVL